MKKLIIALGAAIFTAAMYAIPMLFILSFRLNWDGFWKWFFTILTLLQFGAIWGMICCEADGDD